MPVTGVSELVLEVADLEAAERFYADVLALPVVERWPEREAIWVMAGDRTRIGLWRPQVGVAGGRGGVHVHFALHVEERHFDEALARLERLSLAPYVETRRRLGRTTSRSLYLDDPDGNCVELWTRDVSEFAPRTGGLRGRIPDQGWAHHFDAIAQHVDAEFEAATVRGHWRRARHAAATRLAGSGTGALLEIGTGSGRLLAELAGHGWVVTGLDPAPGMVEIARSRVPAAKLRITVAQAELLPFDDESFDVVVSVGVLGFVDVDAALREVARVLRPGGRAVLGVFNGHAATIAWQQRVVLPVARAMKRVAPFGRPLPWSHRSFTPSEIRRLLADKGMHVEQEEQVGCAVLPDPLDRFLPGFAWRAAEAVERSRWLRRVFGTQYVLVAGKPPVPGTGIPVPGTER